MGWSYMMVVVIAYIIWSYIVAVVMVVTDNDENESQRLPLDRRSGAGVRMSRNSYLGAQPQSSQLLGVLLCAQYTTSRHRQLKWNLKMHPCHLHLTAMHCRRPTPRTVEFYLQNRTILDDTIPAKFTTTFALPGWFQGLEPTCCQIILNNIRCACFAWISGFVDASHFCEFGDIVYFTLCSLCEQYYDCLKQRTSAITILHVWWAWT